jgi:ribonuclease-3
MPKMIKLSADLRQFSDHIGYEFKDPGLLITALTHSSISSATRSDNERLEFLGDRVLGLVMAQALLDADTKASEGQLAPRFNALVRKETCADVARSIGVGDMLKLGRSEMISGGRRKEALLGDAMEALIAAVYRDGGFTAAQSLILRLWNTRITSVKADARDPKTALQEWAQARKGLPPRYVELSRTGPDHAPLFEIEVQLHSGEVVRAKAGSKRQAEQAAAQKMLERLGA